MSGKGGERTCMMWDGGRERKYDDGGSCTILRGPLTTWRHFLWCHFLWRHFSWHHFLWRHFLWHFMRRYPLPIVTSFSVMPFSVTLPLLLVTSSSRDSPAPHLGAPRLELASYTYYFDFLNMIMLIKYSRQIGNNLKIKCEPGVFTQILIFLIFKIFPKPYEFFNNFIVSRK